VFEGLLITSVLTVGDEFGQLFFFSYGRSSSEKQISYTCPSHSKTPTAVQRRHNTRTSRIYSISV